MPPKPPELTLQEIVHLLRRKQSRIKSLSEKRLRILRQLADIDFLINQLPVVKARNSRLPSRFRIRHRPQNDKPLIDYVVSSLKSHKRGMTLQQLAEAVQAAGYVTNSTKFENTLYQCVYHAKNIQRDLKSGRWKLF